MNKLNLVLAGIATLLLHSVSYGYRYNGNKSGTMTQQEKSVSAGCLPPATSAELNVNNVRALIHSGGDMWWDLIANARYEVPKGSGRHALYVGTIWIGGRDPQTQTLKVAAQRYRSGGVDYWTGPLDTLGTASVSDTVCAAYDQIWSITRADVEKFILCNCDSPNDPSCDGYAVPNTIKNWPGNPLVGVGGYQQMQQSLAPYFDANADGRYRWQDCDYPYYDFGDSIECKNPDAPTTLFGDFTLWWVFNDKGNIHGESQGAPIGMEIRAQGFGFTTNDEINNMTFYNYELINRGTNTLSECYFGVNTDADVGGANDDYTGCDVQRGFGFMYNGDAFDDNFSGQLGYGLNPPAIGIDFFEGPYLDDNGVADFWDRGWTDETNTPQAAKDSIAAITDLTYYNPAFGINGIGFDDNIVDNERFGMRRFVYYNNPGTGATGDPENFTQYYSFLRGFWKDGTRMHFGGDGYQAPGTQLNVDADFMFPGDSDPLNWGTRGTDPGLDWREQNTGGSPNTPGDRRFVQSAGPFTLKPGAKNDITVGVVWARSSSGDPYESVLKVLTADIKAQSLFDNCFRILNGPDAPTLNIQELDQELIMYLTNSTSSNNYLNQYEEFNYFIPEFELQTTPITKDTTIYVPSFTPVALGGGDTLYVYQNDIAPPADSLIIIEVNNIPVDTLFGYLDNKSTEILTQIQIGSQTDTVFFDAMIRFEGYLIYQVKNPQVTPTDIFGPDGNTVARLVAQCDIRNFSPETGAPIGRIVNFEFDEDLGYSIPKVKVDGSNEGIVHSFRMTEDQFAVGDNKLINHKSYYYTALAYGYNNYKTFDPNDPTKLDGQKEPFFLGRKGALVYTGIPHIVAPELGGSVINSIYGAGPRITRIEGRGNGGNNLDLTQETIDEIMASPDYRLDRITYDYGRGPVKVKVIDPLKVRGGKFVLKVIDTAPQTFNKVNRTAQWILLEVDGMLDNDTVAIGETDLTQPYEQIMYDRREYPDGVDVDPFLGFSIVINQTGNFGPEWTVADNIVYPVYENNNGLIEATISFEKQDNVWLGFFPDQNGSTPLNWVRSGSVNDPGAAGGVWNSNYFAVQTGSTPSTVFIDPNSAVEQGISFYGGGGIVPYILTSSLSSYTDGFVFPGHGVGHRSSIGNTGVVTPNPSMKEFLGSVDIVLTSDKSKWTRCPVFETQDDPALSFRSPNFPGAASLKAAKQDLRFSPSVDKNGNPADVNQPGNNDPNSANFVNAWGMGWFPGYAIDIETGERLNMAFGEDSYLAGMNGRDMLFNPAQADPVNGLDGFVSQFGDYLLAGKHYIYVYGSNPALTPFASFPHYDEGRTIINYLTDPTTKVPLANTPNSASRNVWRNCMWAGMPFHVQGTTWLDGEAKIRLRVYKNYQSNYSALQTEDAPQNNNNPMYEFSMDDLKTDTGRVATAKSALDLIQVVPNPYYATNEYEVDNIDNRVKIVNLPDRCTISIYALNGTLIRRYEKGTSESTSVVWDLKNQKNIPIASGLYIVHIKAEGIGERIIKWYGVMRPISLDTF